MRLGTLTFDVSTFEIFAPLTSGATLVVPPPGLLSPADLADFFHAHQMWRRWNTLRSRLPADGQRGRTYDGMSTVEIPAP
ncbi:MAG: hypothetical protein J2P15_09710 [Micromonosporaceae bacterium]|nr:hypothetical protein [Micromonosporaceae bacterium]